MKKYFLEITVFVCGACTMMLELVGSRVLAPYLGTSIYVWTSLIGVILGFLSLGYWLGGRVADQRPDAETLSSIIFLAAALAAIVALLGDTALVLIQGWVPDIRMGAVVAATVLFGAPSICLGMVSPYAVKLKIRSFEQAGATVGSLYALSTVGSILGTFLAGFVLISYFSNPVVLFIISGSLAFSSALVGTARLLKIKVLAGVLFFLCVFASESFGQGVRGKDFLDINTPYNRVWIFNAYDGATGKAVKVMQVNDEFSSRMFLESEELADDYAKFYRLVGHFNPSFKKALMIGGAAYSYPKDYLKQFPDATMDVVEIDPQLTALAEKHFKLTPDPRLKIFHEDGRTFLNKTREKYDVIYGDAFKSLTIPYHLTTREVVRKMYDRLNEGGVVFINTISGIEGPKGMFLRAEAATFASVFPQVYLFPVEKPDEGEPVQNIILVALKSPKRPKFYSTVQPELNKFLQHIWFREIPRDMPVLSDTYAPVEKYMIRVISGHARQNFNPIKERMLKLFRSRQERVIKEGQ